MVSQPLVHQWCAFITSGLLPHLETLNLKSDDGMSGHPMLTLLLVTLDFTNASLVYRLVILPKSSREVTVTQCTTGSCHVHYDDNPSPSETPVGQHKI